MSKFILSDVFATMIITGSIQDFTTTEGAEFDIMALTKELKDDIKSCVTYAEMVALAADSGLSCDGKRAIDDDYLAANIDAVWESELLEDCEPDSKTQVGIKVCEISGLTSFIEAQLEKEEEAKAHILDADGSESLEAMAEDAEDYLKNQSVA